MMGRPQKKTDLEKPWQRRNFVRRINVRSQRKQILLICEDTKSAVFYFEEIRKKLPVGSVELCAVGTGKNTQSLVDSVPEIREREEKKRSIPFDEIWVLFDKDSFADAQFDNAIFSGEAKGYYVAWSNECFELWYLLHFQEQGSAIGRNKIYKKLEKHLGLKNYAAASKGEKGWGVHQKFAFDKSRRIEATKRAKQLDKDADGAPHKRNPLTKVYLLFEQLESWIQG